MAEKHVWNYCSVGGAVRVNIATGEDIAHLDELDQKMWTVLSCPVEGLEFDHRTLEMLDTDKDGKIKVNEIVAASKWLTTVLRDSDQILAGSDTLKLADINTDCEEGKKLYDSAKQILTNLGKAESDVITLADASDTKAIFAGSAFNGDGIITLLSTEDAGLKEIITACKEKIGSAEDRCGEAGITADHIEAFYAALKDYSEWMAAAEAGKAEIFPYGDNTAAALAACEAIKDKVADYFMRCKLIAFDGDVAPALDVSVEKIGAIRDHNLAGKSEEIALCPIARPSAAKILSFEGINPAWQAEFDAVKSLVLDVDFAGAESITEEQWNAVLAKFGPYSAWLGSKKGAAVEGLGLEKVNALLAENRKQELLDLVASDKTLEQESAAIDSVHKLMLLYKNLYKLLCNYVIFSDFYQRKPEDRAIFEVGQLYIDRRCCDLCIKVEDMGKHADMAALSGMFLVYCKCTSKVKGATMDIVAVMTDGDTRELAPGKNGVFYDRNGLDWDAVVTKVVDNPISLKQAFWAPYVKVKKFVTDLINKNVADKDAKVTADLQAKAAAAPAAAPAEGAAPKQFDVAKFAGIFAAIGLALGTLGTAIASLAKGIAALKLWQLAVAIAAIMLVISGPSCFIAWGKLRKRNLGPILNANGWAINSMVLVNILFGSKLTSIAKYPKVRLSDPYAKRTPCWVKWLIAIVCLCAAAFAGLWLTGNLCLLGINL